MANFVILYTGGGGMAAEPAQREKIMAAWGAWYGKMGEAIVDGGAPFAASKHITIEGGTANGPLSVPPATGYTVLSADSLDEAAKLCERHPHLKHGGQIQIFETVQM